MKNKFLRIGLIIVCLVFIFTGPVARGLGHPSLWFYLISFIGLSGFIVLDRSKRKTGG